MDEQQLCKIRLCKMNISRYNKIAIYGLGDGAEEIYSVLVDLGIEKNVRYMIDQDQSRWIGTLYREIKVSRLSDCILDTDIIIVAARIHHVIIYERIQKFLNETGIQRIIVDPFVTDNTPEDCVRYVEYIESINSSNNTDFVPISEKTYERQIEDAKVIAWYLPQFYKIPINDKYHGQGFTEWTNSSKAMPLYTGHYQPHIPYDVGYYDLTNVNTMIRQVELAKLYGVYGFCFHYYWFSGKRIMEKPVEMLLEHKEIQMPFCLNWATENWTSLWDGGENELIFEQKLENGDEEKFMDDILPYFRDERYIRIDNKPVLSIYIAEIFGKDKFKKLMDYFRKRMLQEGFDGIYIMLTNARNFDEDVSEWGADALVEFPPAAMRCDLIKPDGYLNPYFVGNIYDYVSYVNEKRYLRNYRSNVVYRSALVSFDNSPRKAKQENCAIMYGATPALFKEWLSDLLQKVRTEHDIDEQYVFVNSWNEWAEGSHLEPDLKYGYGYLQAVQEALLEQRPLDTQVVERKAISKKNSGVNRLHFYIHCIESLGDIIACEPIVRYLKKNYDNCIVTWLVREEYRDVLDYNPNIDEVIIVKCLSDSMRLCKEKGLQPESIIVDCHYNHRRCRRTNQLLYNLNNPQVNERTYFRYGSILETFCLAAGLPALDDAPVFYKNPLARIEDTLPERYVVVHCKSAETCKDWENSKWNELCEYLITQQIDVFEVGFEPQISCRYKGYHDYTDMKDLQKIADLIERASLFIGIDSSFAHIANCFSKRAVLIYGKYKNFESYNPYSGDYKEGRNVRLIRSKMEAKEVSVNDVKEAVAEMLESK